MVLHDTSDPELTLPDAAFVPGAMLAQMSSHSWREMGAVSSSRAGWCLFKMMRRGLWKRVETMIASYIDPFPYFPFSPVLAELYDDLAPGAVFIAGSHARSDGHAEQKRWPGRL
jgi:hypothetical protein